MLAGAPRLTDAARLWRALEPRGYTRSEGPIFSLGEDGRLNLRNRNPADPFGGPMGMSQRIAPTRIGLLVTAETAGLEAALATLAGRGTAATGMPLVQALLAGLDEANLVQAEVLSPALAVGDPARPREPPTAGSPMPPWFLAGLAQMRPVDGAARHRLVLVTPAAEASLAVLLARLRAGEASPRPYGLTAIEGRALPQRFADGLQVVVVEVTPRAGLPAAENPLNRWMSDYFAREPVPFLIGAMPAGR